MEQPPVNFGLETEYGISREGDEDDIDVVAESIALVRATKQKAVRMRWDYECEDPHLDARGFRVQELRQDADEANYFARDAARALTYSEIKSDLVLKNGARFYNDHAHPEYCTPECLSLMDLLHQDHLGDQLVMQCAQTITEKNPHRGRVLLYKNNTDFRGHSYGCHENYLVPRSVTWQTLSQGMMAFLVTRQIYAGAGKYGWEEEDHFGGSGFQISQRADFFSTQESVDTMQRRPIINTRDEPHADPAIFRRFHVICGDANLAEVSTYLKVGATAAVLQALANGAPIERIPRLADPVKTIREISRDRTWRWACRLGNGSITTAVEIQRRYLALAEEFGAPAQVIEHWRTILDDLDNDPLSTADRLDWSAKYRLIEQFRETEGVAEDDPWLMSLDLAYHLLDEQEGLYFGLLDSGEIKAPFSGRRRLEGMDFHPPEGTRAKIRGACIERFGASVELAQWDHVRLNQGGFRVELNLRALFQEDQIHAAWKTVMNAREARDLASLPFAKRLDSH